MSLTAKIALAKLVLALIELFQKQQWFQEGRDAVYAELSEEQRKRIGMAEAARADADAFADGVRDTRQRD